jgi:UDP-N-acetyl-2-amino-2-deoxyglucuronate dehydrogenase
MNKKRIKFAVIGCGRIGSRHAVHIKHFGELKAVCDIEILKCKSLADENSTSIYSEIDQLLQTEKEVDVVSICTPNGLHAEHAIMALKAGFHVLCEKPMAISVYDCGEMIKAAERANKRIFVIKQNRFNPPVAEVKRLIDEGYFGKIYSIQLSCFWNRNENYYKDSWKGTAALDGGTLYTQFSHFIDLLYWMFGDVREVFALTRNFGHQNLIEFEDTGAVALEFYSGALGTINYTVNSYKKNMEGSLTIFGEKGTVKIGGQYLNELEYQCIEAYEIKDLPQGNSPNNYGEYQGSMSNHDKVYENLVSVLRDGDAISANSFEGMKTVEIISRIYESSKKLNTQ